MAELFATSTPNISMNIANILKESELTKYSVVKNFLTTAADWKETPAVLTDSGGVKITLLTLIRSGITPWRGREIA